MKYLFHCSNCLMIFETKDCIKGLYIFASSYLLIKHTNNLVYKFIWYIVQNLPCNNNHTFHNYPTFECSCNTTCGYIHITWQIPPWHYTSGCRLTCQDIVICILAHMHTIMSTHIYQPLVEHPNVNGGSRRDLHVLVTRWICDALATWCNMVTRHDMVQCML